MARMSTYALAQLDSIDPIRCSCGYTRRAFTLDEDQRASMHLLDVQSDARTHYHKKITEIYLILEGEGQMELDGEVVAVKPMTSVMIKPGCRHRAIGQLKVIIVAMPAFDPQDEWFDE
jgi:mannose-6-phosphate isomerase-like protein (cupin superfamily)